MSFSSVLSLVVFGVDGHLPCHMQPNAITATGSSGSPALIDVATEMS